MTTKICPIILDFLYALSYFRPVQEDLPRSKFKFSKLHRTLCIYTQSCSTCRHFAVDGMCNPEVQYSTVHLGIVWLLYIMNELNSNCRLTCHFIQDVYVRQYSPELPVSVTWHFVFEWYCMADSMDTFGHHLIFSTNLYGMYNP